MSPQVAPEPSDVDRLAQHAGHAAGLQAGLDAAAGQLADRLHRVDVVGVDHVGGAELLRQRQPSGAHVDRDDRRAAADDRRHHRRQPDAAGAEDGQRRAGQRAQDVDDAARAGLHAAAERRDDLERDVVGDRPPRCARARSAPVAKLDWPKKCECTGSPSCDSAVVPSARVARKLRSKNSAQWKGRPVAHTGSRRTRRSCTRRGRPPVTRVTAAPTSSTTPAPSWPRTTGIGVGNEPSRMSRSVWQMPEADDPHPHLVGLHARELDARQLERRAARLHDGGGDGGGDSLVQPPGRLCVRAPVHPAGLVASAR